MFSWYKYLIVSLVFSHLGFWSGSLFLIAPFLDLCLLVLFEKDSLVKQFLNNTILCNDTVSVNRARFFRIMHYKDTNPIKIK